MAQHTPGPWVPQWSPANNWTIWHDPRVHGDMKRGAVVVAGQLRAGEEGQANARLIAAAPDLLQQLQEVRLWLVTLPHLGGEMEDDRVALHHDINATIDKAIGP
jgi:hypothetical protein